MTRWLVLLLLFLPAATCQVNPTPPSPTGGTSPIADAGPDWINPWVDAGSAEERCTEDKSADPVVQNVATKSGTPLWALVQRMCSDPLVLEPYRGDQ